jgi:hypothetical protein
MKPANFPLGSIESRAEARALAESRESLPYRCSTCVLTGFPVIGNNDGDFTPNERMEKGSDGWVWKCPKHKDPSKEATVQALIKSGMLGGPTARD